MSVPGVAPIWVKGMIVFVVTACVPPFAYRALPSGEAGMPNAKSNTVAVEGPLAVTVTVGSESAGSSVTLAVGVPKPAAAPAGPVALVFYGLDLFCFSECFKTFV